MKTRCMGLIICLCSILVVNPYNLCLCSDEKQKFCSNTVHVEIINGRFFLWAEPELNSSNEDIPVIFLLHGAAQHAFSWFISWNKWSSKQVSFTKAALEKGFFIVSLESQKPIRPGPRAWDVFEKNFSANQDLQFIKNITIWLNNTKPQVNTNKLFCTGFSSGAFMCSRIALSIEDLFQAIALNSGCNADSISLTARGPVFDISSSYNLSKNHPPTLILHGKEDKIVPPICGVNYYNDLQKSGINSSLLIESEQGHVWLKDFNNNILDWFLKYL